MVLASQKKQLCASNRFTNTKNTLKISTSKQNIFNFHSAKYVFLLITSILVFVNSSEADDLSSLDSSLGRTFRSAAYLQRSNPSRGVFGMGRSYSNNLDEYSKISKMNIREKDIAAIFRGVAYGITERNNDSPYTTTTTIAPTSAITVIPTRHTSPSTTTLQKVTTTSTATFSSNTLSSSPIMSPKSQQHTKSKNVVFPDRSVVENLLETNNIIETDPKLNEVPIKESSRNGILNYFVEDTDENSNADDEENDIPVESSHSGRREFYPEVISSVEPETFVNDRRKYVVSQNGDRQSIDVHVYMIGILMGLVALASLCCLCRIHSCSQLIPRGHYVTLQLLILLAASLRCITLLHDPYGLEGKLPRTLIALLMNTLPPILSTTFALMLLVLLRAAKFFILPASLQSPVALAIVSGIHITLSVLVDISNGVLNYPESSRAVEAGVQCFTVGWDTLLIVGYSLLLFQAFIKRTSKRMVILPQYTCAIVSIAVVIKAILIGFMFYHIFNGEFNDTSYSGSNIKTWSWWLIVSCERLLEIFMCISLLTAAATLTMRQNNFMGNEQKIFSVVSDYDQSVKCNTVDPGNKNFMATNYALATTLQIKGNTMNSKFARTFSPTNSKTYESSDFTIQWNTPKSDNCYRTIDRLENIRSGSNVEPFDLSCNSVSTNSTTVKPYCNNTASVFSKTLPKPRYYCAPVPLIDRDTPVVGHIEQHVVKPMRTPHIYCEIGNHSYDLPSYYSKSEASTSCDIYSNPQNVPHYAQAASNDHLYEMPDVHQNNKVDYASHYHRHNVSPVYQQRGQELQDQVSYNMMLPLQPQQQMHHKSTLNHPHFRSNNNQLDTSPDSAIVLDYSSHSEIEEHNHQLYSRHAQNTMRNIQEQLNSPTSRLDFMKLSTHSLNDVFKHNGGLLSKLVCSGNNDNTGYQPLNVDDFNPGNETNSSVVSADHSSHRKLDSPSAATTVSNEQSKLSNFQNNNGLTEFNKQFISSCAESESSSREENGEHCNSFLSASVNPSSVPLIPHNDDCSATSKMPVTCL